MAKITKLINLKRLNYKNICLVISYLVKTILKIGPSEKEKNVYIYYNLLIQSDGYFSDETELEFITVIKENYYKCIKTRKKPKSSDLDVFKMILIDKEYLPVVKAFKKHFDSNCVSIIDAGSNIGLTTLFFINYFSKVKIVCIEPENENFKTLEFNLQNCNNAEILKIKGAIWKSNSKIKIVNDFKDKLNWAYRVEETDEKTAITAYTIEEVVKKANFSSIDILKIDIEGSEKQIFDSEVSNVDFLKITKCLAIEIHDFFDCRKQIYDVLDSYNFSYFNEGELTIAINNNLINTNNSILK